MTQKSKVIKWNDKIYHDKTIRTYYINKDGIKSLKPFAKKVKDALNNGDAIYIDKPPKHIYLYTLRR